MKDDQNPIGIFFKGKRFSGVVIVGGCLVHVSRFALSENPGIALMLGQADCGCR